MASISKIFFFIFLLTLISFLQINARESQFFNKIPSNNGEKVVIPSNNGEKVVIANKDQDPDFMPENENSGYGLFGHESGQLPPSTTTTNVVEPYKSTTPTTTSTTNVVEPYKSTTTSDFPNSKYLPKNYNSVAYVTVSEDNTDAEFDNNNQMGSTEFSLMGNNNNNGGNSFYSNHEQSNPTNYNHNNGGYNNYYNNQEQSIQEQSIQEQSNPTNYNHNNGGYNNYYNNQEQSIQEQSNPTNYNHNNGGNWVQKQGLSDTRFLDNGKYYYNVETEKYARNPHEIASEFGARNEYSNMNSYGNNEFNNNNSVNGEDFEDEDIDDEMP